MRNRDLRFADPLVPVDLTAGLPRWSRSVGAFGCILALYAIVLALSASPASATYLHDGQSSVAFGPDGTNNITVENSFYSAAVGPIAVDSKRRRLYVVHFANPYNTGCDGCPYPGVPRGLYGFDISDPSNPKPLEGNFPLAIQEKRSGADKLVVDEEDGNIYMLERAEECYCEPGGTLYAWNSEGKALSGYPTHVNRYGPMALDTSGYLWIWHEGSLEHGDDHLGKYLPDGTLVEELEPTFPSDVGNPENLVFNKLTGDLWLQFYEGAVKYTADSGYTSHEPPIRFASPPGSGWLTTPPLALDSGNGVLYQLQSGSAGGRAIEPLNEQGGMPEDPFGLGGEEYYDGEKCGGTCIPVVPETRITALAYDEPTGDVYVVNDGRGRQYNEEEENAKSGRLEIYLGIGASDAQTGPAAATGKTDATLTGRVGPGEGPPVTECKFQYVDDESFNHVRIVSIVGATSGLLKFPQSEKPVPYNATGFEIEHAFYEYVQSQLHVTGPAGGPWRFETTGSGWPSIAELTSPQMSEVKPVGTRIHADWEGSTAPCEPAASVGSPFSEEKDVKADISGLSPATTYHYRVIATSAAGTVWGGIESFATTHSKVSTGPATEIERESATLTGTVDPEGQATTYYFEYGRTAAYGQTTSSPPGEDVGTTAAGDHAVSDPVSGLEPGKTYHYRIVAVNESGTSKGVDRTFTTVPAVLDVETQSADEIERAQAMLHGKLDPDGISPTHYRFEWGTTRRYGEESGEIDLASTSPGDQEVSFLATGLTAGTTYHYRIAASNSFGTTYGDDQTFTTDIAVKNLTTEPATEIKTEEATLNGKLDPDGIPTSFYFEWGKSTAYGQVTPLPPGESVSDSSPGDKSVSYVLGNLEPGTTYHYRIVAENGTGVTVDGDQVFTTKHGPAIEGVHSEQVTADGAVLKARVNPSGFETEWYFEYGLTSEYGALAPVPPGKLGALTGGQPVSVELTGLQNAVYHFRLVAKNEWGTVASEDQTFEFAPPVCPNTALRQQTGANYLPDCRAYELVTPGRAAGTPLLPYAPMSPVAGDHLGFSGLFNALPGTDAPNAGRALPNTDFYVATRTPGGWKTAYVGVKGNETLESREILWDFQAGEGSSGIPADEHLEHFLTWEQRPPCCGDTGSYSPFFYDAEGHFLGRLPTNAGEIPGVTTLAATEGGFRGDGKLSGDGKHYVFSSVRVAFAPGGLTAPPGSAYDNNVETGNIEKISFDEAGEDLKQDPHAPAGYVLGGEEFIKFRSVSSDASHVLMSVPGPNEGCSDPNSCKPENETVHLYMHVRGKGTYDVSSDTSGVDRGVRFAGTARGGSEVFFTSGRQLTEDDHDQSVDLFRWDEATNEVTRLSAGTGGSGNADGCSGSWTSRCSVQVVPISHACIRPDHAEMRECGDSVIARETGEIYFYSPEQLDGARGVAGNRNLYVWREGRPRFVASLDSAHPAERMNVSFEGNWMAFLTRSRITPYDNAGFSEMYRFNAPTDTVICVSCRPDGGTPTSDALASMNGYFLTNDGRTFFSTREPLVDRDADGVSDTYEYTGGRAQLISNGAETGNGNDSQPIGLIGVTSDGEDAFFSTLQTLVGQDENGHFYKIYDARVNGGFPFQRPPLPCAAADECHGEGNPNPAPPVIGSSAGLGERGNFTRAKHHKRRHQHRKHRKHRKHRSQKKKAHGGQKGAGR